MPTSDTAEIRIMATYSARGISEDVVFSPPDYTMTLGTPGQYYRRLLVVTIPSVTINTTAFSSITTLLAKNIDASNYVEVSYTYTDDAGTDHANVTRLPAGGILATNGPIKPGTGITFATSSNPVAVELCIIGQ